MTRSLYIHIGTHKTGTTSFQSFLRTRAEELGKAGVYVPSIGSIGPLQGHFNIAWELLDDPRYNAIYGGLDELLSELRRTEANKALISSEDFEYLVRYPEKLANFEHALRESGWEPAYIVTFRRADHYAVSLYSELTRKQGLKGISFERFALQILRDGFFATSNWYYAFDYAEFIRMWRLPGRGALTVLHYGPEMTPDILAAIGVPLVPGKQDRFNVSEPLKFTIRQAVLCWLLRLRFPLPFPEVAGPATRPDNVHSVPRRK